MSEDAAPRIDVLRGNPTDEELAAVIAVAGAAYAQESSAALADEPSRPSAWRISQRGLRQPLRRDIGWGRFGR
ncbi:MAG: acyl-CoA carboxylase epsilon subunit [Microbacterium sp.]|uniref:acyl-CoA carboxylase epsilon subunit n=1 Tax=Microbacterium sp. TaxID=51671 RepID=UPI0039E36117